jgi:hypothetical protein
VIARNVDDESTFAPIVPSNRRSSPLTFGRNAPSVPPSRILCSMRVRAISLCQHRRRLGPRQSSIAYPLIYRPIVWAMNSTKLETAVKGGGPCVASRLPVFAVLGLTALASCTSQPPAPTVSANLGATEGAISFTGGAVAIGVGFQWGSGILTYQGRQYPFRLDGLSVVDVGVTRVTGSGTVRNLRNITDFNGNYVSITAGATLVGGGSVTVTAHPLLGSARAHDRFACECCA